MSGAGRKSAYRKSVTEEVLHSFPEPNVAAGERVARVVQSRGGNILQVCLRAYSTDRGSAVLSTGVGNLSRARAEKGRKEVLRRESAMGRRQWPH